MAYREVMTPMIKKALSTALMDAVIALTMALIALSCPKMRMMRNARIRRIWLTGKAPCMCVYMHKSYAHTFTCVMCTHICIPSRAKAA